MTQNNAYVRQWKPAVRPQKGFTNRARAVIRHVALSALGNLTPDESEPFLRCIYCHYVFDDQTTRFEKIISMLKSVGTFVDTDTCISMVKGERPIDDRFFHLSFDDGFRNVFTNAFPILKRLKVPAIVFVPTALIGADYDAVKNFCLKGYGGVIELLNWEELRILNAEGYEIGSHTRNHARFSELADTGMLEHEICGSKSDLESGLQTECKYISWPYGTRRDVDAASLAMTRRAGYRACFGAFRGNVVPNQTDLYSIPRHHFEPQWSSSHVRYFAAGRMKNR